MKRLDLSGLRQGKLTVLKRVENKGKDVMWLCRCECGKEKEISTTSIRHQNRQTCGCRISDATNLVGRKFGILTVESRASTNKWNCLCDCGKVTVLRTTNLLRGHDKSCGCFRFRKGEDCPWLKDLTGMRFGMLTVVGFFRFATNRSYWKCQCDCGKEKIAKGNNLRRGHTQSCGCNSSPKGQFSSLYTGIGKLSGQYLASIRCGARARGFDYSITKEYAYQVFLSQNEKCSLTGLPITLREGRSYGETSASLDRIDSSKGYIEGNIQWVHKDINRIKQAFSQEKFIEYCQLVVNHQNSKVN